MNTVTALSFGLALVALAVPRGETLVREEKTVSVDATPERWLLKWRTQPVEACGPTDPQWFTCPCQGFAFGETGMLDLVRRRPGHGDETLPLAPFFADEENPGNERGVIEVVLQRWPVLRADDTRDHSAALTQRVHARAVTRVMQFGDYDHDGRATEFVLLVGSTPCGHDAAVVVGLSRNHPTLHAFTSVAHPERPLVLDTKLWRGLLHSRGSVNKPELRCGDHGGGEETDVQLRTSDRGIEATRRVYACTPDDRRGALKSTEAF